MSSSCPEPRAAGPLGIAILVVSGAVPASGQCAELEVASVITRSDAESFGRAVAVSDDWLVVGASSNPDGIVGGGEVHLYQRSGTGWSWRQRLTASDADEQDYFGFAVAVHGNRVLVGAPYDDDACGGPAGCNSGSAYVFDRTPSGWVEVAKLTASDHYIGDRFGQYVALHGGTAVIGQNAYNQASSAYVFEQTPTGWIETAILAGHDSAPDDAFGEAVTVFGDTIVVGAQYNDGALPNTGAAYVFHRSATGWVQRQKLTTEVPVEAGRLGSAVSVHGDRLIVGAHGETLGPNGYGAAYVFERGALGWSEVSRVTPGACSGSYGSMVVMGAELALVPTQCKTFVIAPVGPDWEIVYKILPPDASGAFAAAVQDRRVFVARAAHDVRDTGGVVWTYEAPGGTSYCASSPNSTGAHARITAEGCTQVATNHLWLVAGPVPAEPGYFFYGTQPALQPFGNGWLCVGQPWVVLPPVAGTSGTLAYELDLDTLPPHGTIFPGSTWYFQASFRDVAAGGAQFDTSDGVRVTFLP